MSIRKLAAGAALTALALAASSAVYAQQTTGSIRGTVTDDAGKPVAGATVTATHVPTGTKETAVSGGDGSYDIPNLRPGGPYTVEVTSGGLAAQKINIPSIGLGSGAELNVVMTSGSAVAEITVTAAGSKGGIKELVTGPVTAFSSRDVETLPSFNRDLKDLVRLNPFVTLDPTNSNALVVAGANNRVNTIYIDGVKQADDFGLNANGYPSQRSPISIDWVKDFNFEIAPYDVEYGEFQGGLLNIVTKEGSNSFHGSVYYQGDNSSIAGTDFIGPANPTAGVGARDVKVTPFFHQTYGITGSGPIIPDKLFFYGAYENFLTESVPTLFGPEDSSAANKVLGLTTAELNQIITTVQNVYHFDPLSDNTKPLPQTDQKYFARIDWNITDHQRAMFSYQEDDGVTLSNGGSSSAKQIDLLSQFYNLNQTLRVANAQLFSDWTDQFSTEIAFNWKNVQSIRAPLAGNSFAQFTIRLDPTADDSTGASVVLGPDISSQANILKNTDELLRLRGHYKWDNHVFTFGYERENLTVFNLFDQNANGAYTFASNTTSSSGVACYPGQTVMQDLAAGNACSLTYANSASNVSTAAAASWQDADNIFYAQDEWSLTKNLTIRLGMRGELYSNATAVPVNVAGFQSVYGFPNTSTFAGRGIAMPRFGFNWTPDPTLTVTGGVGLFGGGDPNVWLSNSYTNTGILIGSVSCSLSASGGNAVISGLGCTPGTLTGVNTITGSPVVNSTVKGLNTNSANLGAGITNVVDPHFQLPSTWKASVSVVKMFDLGWFGPDWRLHGDALFEQVQEGITWKDLWAAANPGTAAPDGRPTFNNARFNNCGATTAGPNAHSCYSLELTNDQVGGGTAWAIGIGKSWNDGWAKGLDFDLTYSHQNIGEGNPATSSVALSNYSQWAVSDRNNPVSAPSNYEINWEAKLSVGYEHAFWREFKSSFRIYVQDLAGFPFSYTFFPANTSNSANIGDQAFGETQAVATRGTELLYVPKTNSSGNVTATSDPIVQYASTVNVAAWNTYLHQTGLIKYAGQIAPRNAFLSPDSLDADLRFEQELPAFLPNGAKLKLWFDIINLPNLLNKHWGVLEQTGFPGVVSPITAINCQATAPTPIKSTAFSANQCASGYGNYYTYTGLFTTTNYTLDNSSDWYMDLGIKYEF